MYKKKKKSLLTVIEADERRSKWSRERRFLLFRERGGEGYNGLLAETSRGLWRRRERESRNEEENK